MRKESQVKSPVSKIGYAYKVKAGRTSRLAIAGLTFLFVASYTTSSAFGQVNAIANTPTTVVNGTATLLGPFDANQTLHLVIGLKHPNLAAEQQFLSDLQTVSKGQFHQYLTADQYNAQFAPSVQDEQAIVNWAATNGLTVTNRFPNRLLVDVEGTVATVQRALNVKINSYQLGAQTGFSNDRDPSIPANLAGIVQSIAGLQNLHTMQPLNKKVKEPVFPIYAPGPAVSAPATASANGDHSKLPQQNGPSPNFTSGAPYDPQDLYSTAAYDASALYNLGHCCNPFHISSGSPPETSIAIATAGSQLWADIAGFQSNFPYLAYNVNQFGIDGQSVPCTDSTDSGCDGEGTLDMQWSTAMANSFGSYLDTAHVYMYDGINANFGTFEDIYNHMLSDGLARNFSTSWGCQETACFDNSDMNTTDGIFGAMVAQGWSLTAAAGDHGATASCSNSISVMYPASDPFVVGAGGTTLYLSGGPPPGYSSFSAWSGGPDGCALGNPRVNDGGTGGGYSAFFGAPSYQSGFPSRGVPDIALDADWYNTPTYMYFAGGLNGNGGTSIVAPETVGFFAQENAYLLYLGNICGSGSSPCAPMGAVNPYLYDAGNFNGAPHNPYYDVTAGCNNNDVTAFYGIGYYCAGPGWDPVTGWGQYNFLQLAWAINWYHIPGFTNPVVSFSGPAVNHWYNTDQVVSWTVASNPGNGFPSSGLAGFTQRWDADPGNEAVVKATPGLSGFPGSPYDAFYDGPQYPNASAGCLDFTGASCLGSVGQGMHTVNVRAWGNEGERSGDATYGPIGYDTIVPVTAVTLSGTKSGSTYVTPVKVTLTGTDPGYPSTGSGIAGTVYQLDGSAVTNYSGPFTVSSVGSHTVLFHSTDIAGNVGSSKSTTFTIAADTSTSLTSSKNPSGVGTTVTFKAQVLATGSVTGTPTGSVQFKDGSTVLSTQTLSGGIASYSTSTLALGSHSMTAVFSGSSEFFASTSSVLTQKVEEVSTTSLVSSLNPSTYGKTVTFTATIGHTAAPIPTGTVTFKNGGSTMGTATLSSGKATFTISTLSVGTHSITAVYGGDSNYVGSTSSPVSQVVDKASTSTKVTSSLNPSTFGQTVTFTAVVTSLTTGTPAGTVTFKDGTTTLATKTLTSGDAAYSTSTLAKGSHSITAVYNGNVDFLTSTSPILTQKVN